MPVGTSICSPYPKLIQVSNCDHPTFTFFCGHVPIVKHNRAAESGSTPMCHNVPQPMNNIGSLQDLEPTHPPNRADTPPPGRVPAPFPKSGKTQTKPPTHPQTPPPRGTVSTSH